MSYTQLVHDLHMTSTWLVHDLFNICSCHLFITCSLLVHVTCSQFLQLVHDLIKTFHNFHVYMTRTWLVHNLFMTLMTCSQLPPSLTRNWSNLFDLTTTSQPLLNYITSTSQLLHNYFTTTTQILHNYFTITS